MTANIIWFFIGACFGWVAWRSYYLGALDKLDNHRVSYMNDRILFMLQQGYRPILFDDKLDFMWKNDGGTA